MPTSLNGESETKHCQARCDEPTTNVPHLKEEHWIALPELVRVYECAKQLSFHLSEVLSIQELKSHPSAETSRRRDARTRSLWMWLGLYSNGAYAGETNIRLLWKCIRFEQAKKGGYNDSREETI